MLVTAFRSPAAAAPFEATIPGSTFPACYFASSPAAFPARSAFPLRNPCPVRPGRGRFHASDPLQFPPLASPATLPAFAPRRDSYFHPDRSLTKFAANPARLPNPPDFLSLPATVSIARFRLRIIVPGPLRFRRLAVPQTSWNLIHYDPKGFLRQPVFGCLRAFSSIFIWFISMGLPMDNSACRVDKTRRSRSVFAYHG